MSAEIVRRWSAVLQDTEPDEGARLDAAAWLADITSCAARRASAATGLADPLPRRMDAVSMDMAVSVRLRAIEFKAKAETKARQGVSGVLEEVAAFQHRSAALLASAHAAGLAWLPKGDGPKCKAGQGWCTNFLAAGADLLRAKVHADACKEVAGMHEATSSALHQQLQGGTQAPAHALPAWQVIG